MQRFALILVACAIAFSAEARQLRGAPAPDADHWSGVGKLNVAGKGFCTATLVSERHALTAAHCVFDSRSRRKIQPRAMRFVMGAGRRVVSRQVRRVAVLDEHDYNPRASLSGVGSDVALLELDAPVSRREAASFDVGGSMRGDLTMVSYSQRRPHAPSVNGGCRVGGSQGSIRAMSCLVGHGASGAPIFETRNGRPRVVAIVSASGRNGNRPATLAVHVEPLLARLRNRLAR